MFLIFLTILNNNNNNNNNNSMLDLVSADALVTKNVQNARNEENARLSNVSFLK